MKCVVNVKVAWKNPHPHVASGAVSKGENSTWGPRGDGEALSTHRLQHQFSSSEYDEQFLEPLHVLLKMLFIGRMSRS